LLLQLFALGFIHLYPLMWSLFALSVLTSGNLVWNGIIWGSYLLVTSAERARGSSFLRLIPLGWLSFNMEVNVTLDGTAFSGHDSSFACILFRRINDRVFWISSQVFGNQTAFWSNTVN
jgi:hypothetical protein